MKQTITTVFTAEQVAKILGTYALQLRELTPEPDTRLTAEMMAMFEKDRAGNVGITQYRIEVEFEQEAWRGDPA